MSDRNGLLLLWNAAVQLEGSEIEKMIIQARNRRNHSLKLLKSNDSAYSHSCKGSLVPIRHSHNELEKSRRAHLRLCMEKLKKVLRFDQESVPCRITMLNVLKKATTTIHDRERNIHVMNVKETISKNRFVELTNRLNNFQRQIKKLRNIHMKSMESEKAIRMRNYSECSILTMSSDDSAFDVNRSRQPSINYSKGFEDLSPLTNDKDEELSKIFKSSAILDDVSVMSGNIRNVFKCSSPNSNSCDSGFEESHIHKNGVVKPTQRICINIHPENQSSSVKNIVEFSRKNVNL